MQRAFCLDAIWMRNLLGKICRRIKRLWVFPQVKFPPLVLQGTQRSLTVSALNQSASLFGELFSVVTKA
jgi:hypothetical protein